jgi:phosphotriesterase-related protein
MPADEPGQRLCRAPLTPEIASRIRFGGQPNLDNARLDDIDAAVEELALFRTAGGGTVVEVTNVGLHRDPKGLRRIAERTGLRIVMGSSYYVDAAHPDDMAGRSEDAICAEIVADVLDGADGTGICSGIIGEAGCSWPLTAAEAKVLRASARAQRLTGAPLSVHPGRSEDAPMQIVEILADSGADLSRTVICHLERTVFSRPAMKRLAGTGCVLEFDLFGHENSYYWPAPHIAMPNDAQRLDWLAWLIAEGHRDQIVVSHDNDNKVFLARHGGPGYAHILTNIVPRMRARGFGEEDIEAILIANPRRILAFV